MYALGVVGFIWCRWVHLGAPWGSLRSSVDVGFTRVRPGVRWVHPGSLRSLRCALGVVGFIRGRLVHSRAHTDGVVFMRVVGSSDVVGFTLVHHGGHSVHPESLVSRGCAFQFDGFIMRGWVHSGTRC